MIAYVLTRTAGRPRMFQRARESILAQDHRPIVHVVHQERPSRYAVADHVITGRPQSGGTAPYELHQRTLLAAVASMPPGWVLFLDDDDEFTTPASVRRMLAHATSPDIMPVWRVERENGRISPTVWRGDLASFDGRLCWEAAAHHTSHIGKAVIDANDGADGRYWQQMSQHLRVAWVDEVMMRPQAGKGKGRRRDY